MVRVGDQVRGLAGWDIPSVIATFAEASRLEPDASRVNIVTGKSMDAEFKTKATLSYPLVSQQMDVSGKVTALVQIGPDGDLETARVGTSSGSKMLDDAAMASVKRSTFYGSALDGIPIASQYSIYYEFRLGGEPWPPDLSDLLKTTCPAILGIPTLNASLNAGTAYWYALSLSTAERKFDSISIEMADTPAHVNDLSWNTLLPGYNDTMDADSNRIAGYSTTTGALFWPGAALTSGTVQAVTEHAKQSAACKPNPTDVWDKPDDNTLVAVATTVRPWLTAPIVETVLPARFATVSWPKYAPGAGGPRQSVVANVSIHVSRSGEPLIGVIHGVPLAPGFAAAALNAAMASTYVVPRTADGVSITQTFSVDYLYVPASAAAGKPVGLVSHDRSDGNRRSTPHH